MAKKIMDPAQKAINEAEWNDADNWGGPRNLAVYFSKKDTRIWVPQQKKSFGVTPNLAHSGGILWMVAICLGIILVMAMMTIWVFGEIILAMF